MKRFLVGIMLFSVAAFLASFAEPEKKWLVTGESRLEISGSSNVNEFQCLNGSYAGNDTLYEEKSAVRNVSLLNGVITLSADRFDCQNKLITNDFRRTLNADENPEIKVRFLRLKIPKSECDREPVSGQVEITIGGVSRKYDINCQFMRAAKSKAQLKGEKTVRLSDFGLEPRPKVLGLIKVDDTVQVNFHLIIQSI